MAEDAHHPLPIVNIGLQVDNRLKLFREVEGDACGVGPVSLVVEDCLDLFAVVPDSDAV